MTEKAVMRGTKRNHRSLRKASTNVQKSRSWPAELQLLTSSPEVATPVIKVTTAVPSTRQEEKSRERQFLTHRLHQQNMNMKITKRHNITHYFCNNYRTQLLPFLLTVCHVNSLFYFPNHFCENYQHWE